MAESLSADTEKSAGTADGGTKKVRLPIQPTDSNRAPSVDGRAGDSLVLSAGSDEEDLTKHRYALVTAPLEKFTDEAAAAYRVAIDNYAEDLAVRSRNNAVNEKVLKADVDGALAALRPTSGREATKILADWLKRLGFLFVGFAAAQFQFIQSQSEIDRGSVYWLTLWVLLATGLVVAGICFDRGLAGSVGRKIKRNSSQAPKADAP